jgi:hypothetical protein
MPTTPVPATVVTISSPAVFEQRIKKWVELDNQLKELNEQARTIRAEKTEISTHVMTYVETNSLNNAVVNITDGRLKFAETKQTAAITLAFVEKCLGEVITNESQVKQIMNYIKQKRETKKVPEIKRYYSTKKTTSESGAEDDDE